MSLAAPVHQVGVWKATCISSPLPEELYLQNWPLFKKNQKKIQKKPELCVKSGNWGGADFTFTFAVQ